MSEIKKELVLGIGPVPMVIALDEPRGGARREMIVLSWVLDSDGTGSAVVMIPNGTCARVDRLIHDGWSNPEVLLVRGDNQSSILVP